MSDKDEAKVDVSKESGYKKSARKIDGINELNSISSGNKNKNDKNKGTDSSTTTKPSPSPSTQSGTATTTTTASSVATSASNTTTKIQADAYQKNSDHNQKSNVSDFVPKYNNQIEDPVTVSKITSNYFCFDCGAIMTTIEDKEQHMIIESERKNKTELTAEE